MQPDFSVASNVYEFAEETLVNNRLYYMDLAASEADPSAKNEATLRAYFDKNLGPAEVKVAQQFLETQLGRMGAAEVFDATIKKDGFWTQLSLNFKVQSHYKPEEILQKLRNIFEYQRQEIAKAERAAEAAAAARQSEPAAATPAVRHEAPSLDMAK